MKKLTMLGIMFLIFSGFMVVYATDTSQININTADIKTLCLLKRVGVKYAERIIAYREANGVFNLPEDIQKVTGIGLKTYLINKDRITVETTDIIKTNKTTPEPVNTSS